VSAGRTDILVCLVVAQLAAPLLIICGRAHQDRGGTITSLFEVRKAEGARFIVETWVLGLTFSEFGQPLQRGNPDPKKKKSRFYRDALLYKTNPTTLVTALSRPKSVPYCYLKGSGGCPRFVF
jgi:hypothetical protein